MNPTLKPSHDICKWICLCGYQAHCKRTIGKRPLGIWTNSARTARYSSTRSSLASSINFRHVVAAANGLFETFRTKSIFDSTAADPLYLREVPNLCGNYCRDGARTAGALSKILRMPADRLTAEAHT